MGMKQRVALENLILPQDASLHELSITILFISYREGQELSMVLCIWDKIAHKNSVVRCDNTKIYLFLLFPIYLTCMYLSVRYLVARVLNIFQANVDTKQGKFQPKNDSLTNRLETGYITREAKLNNELLCVTSIIKCSCLICHSLNEIIISY